MSEMVPLLGRELMEAVASHVGKYPEWLKPLALLLSMLLACCAIIAATPLLLLTGVARLVGFGRIHELSLQAVRLEVRRLWSEQSPEAAVRRLREIIKVLEDSRKNTVFVQPYGRLWTAPALTELLPMLYEFEVARNNWAGGLGLADDMVKVFEETGSGYWYKARARCLIKLGRPDEARRFLFAVRNPQKPDPEVERLLSEVGRGKG